jgi:RES domain-containing protein
MTLNSRYETFVEELKSTKHRFCKWRGVAFRAAPLEYARMIKLLDGKGSLKFGGRWSAAGTFRAVNLSTTQATAVEESIAKFKYYKLTLKDTAPRVIVAVRFKLGKVIDLTEPDGLGGKAWLRLSKLLIDDWRKANDAGLESESQAFGRAAHDLGAEAILTPSAQISGGVNLVYFPESVLGPNKVEIVGQEELLRWIKKR